MRFAFLLIAVASTLFSADIQWGLAESGLQLGIDVTATPEPALRISLKNVGIESRDSVIGEAGAVDFYNVEIATRAPGQPDQPVFDLHALQASSSSLLLPISAHLQPGEVREFVYPLSQLICVVNRRDVPFRALFERGYSVHASLEFPGVTLVTPDLTYMW